MSDATARIPAQSASQLSENIGDVLASIRRLIAQDEAAEAAAAAGWAPFAPVPEAAASPRRASLSESVARRRDILAEAQALTRRSEAGFGQAAVATPPLTLGAAERVAAGGAALPGRAVATVTDEGTGNAARPLVLTEPVAVAAPVCSPAAPVAQAMQAIAAAAPQAAAGGRTILPPHPASAAEAATNEDEAEDMYASETPAPDTASPAGQTGMGGAPTLAAGGAQEAPAAAPLQPAISASPAAQPALGAPSAAHLAPTPAMPAGAAAFAPASAPPTPTETPEPATQRAAPASPAPAPVIEDAAADEEDCTAMILRDMIREVVRQELTGDPAGRMAGDLRSMIMREVAQVLTKGGRGAR